MSRTLARPAPTAASLWGILPLDLVALPTPFAFRRASRVAGLLLRAR